MKKWIIVAILPFTSTVNADVRFYTDFGLKVISSSTIYFVPASSNQVTSCGVGVSVGKSTYSYRIEMSGLNFTLDGSTEMIRPEYISYRVEHPDSSGEGSHQLIWPQYKTIYYSTGTETSSNSGYFTFHINIEIPSNQKIGTYRSKLFMKKIKT